MKFYLASRFKNRETLLKIETELQNKGHIINSRWLHGPIVPHDAPDYEDHCKEWANKDLEDIANSDAIIIVTNNCEKVPGGIWWEAGFAMGLGKTVFICGPKINVFCHHESIEYYEDIDKMLENIGKIYLSIKTLINKPKFCDGHSCGADTMYGDGICRCS